MEEINPHNCRCEVNGHQCKMIKKYPLNNPRFCHHHVDCPVDFEFKKFSKQRQEQVKKQKQEPDRYARQEAEIVKLIEQEREMKKKMKQDPELKKFREEMRRKKQRGEKN